MKTIVDANIIFSVLLNSTGITHNPVKFGEQLRDSTVNQ